MTPSGRLEVICIKCGGLYWPYPDELKKWEVCPHCEGWWQMEKIRDLIDSYPIVRDKVDF